MLFQNYHKMKSRDTLWTLVAIQLTYSGVFRRFLGKFQVVPGGGFRGVFIGLGFSVFSAVSWTFIRAFQEDIWWVMGKGFQSF